MQTVPLNTCSYQLLEVQILLPIYKCFSACINKTSRCTHVVTRRAVLGKMSKYIVNSLSMPTEPSTESLFIKPTNYCLVIRNCLCFMSIVGLLNCTQPFTKT